MNKTSFFLLILLGLVSCQGDDIKNTYTLSGKIGYPLSEDFVISDLAVSSVLLLSNDQVIASSNGGTFSFENLEEGKSYTILPQPSNDEGRNGLSTLDKVQIDNYIKGLLVLSPFQKIAADVNKDNKIDDEDQSRITTCIVQNDNCPTWRFASADYDGSGHGYIDQYSVSKLLADQEIIFVPVKLGDVSGTIQPH